MNKYLWGLGLLFFGGLAVFAFFATGNYKKSEHKSYEPSPLTLVIDWEITKPFTLQVFYLKDKDDNFNSKSSVQKKVTPQDKHVEVVLPVKRIYNFRIDFGTNPEKVVIKNIEIKGDMYLNFNNWHEYMYLNINKTKVHHDDNSLELYSTHSDPYMVFQFPFVLDAKK